MKLFNQSLAGLLLIAGLASPLYADTASPDAKPKQAVRYLLLAQNSDGGGNECKIPITGSITINLNDNDQDIWGCENDEMTYFQLDNVNSATRIFFGKATCGDTDNWGVEIRTYIQPISTPWLSLPDLKGRVVGDIVSRGLRLEKGYNGGDDMVGELTCVKITVSEPG